jgi:uncharacterized protein YbaP (TraB family)
MLYTCKNLVFSALLSFALLLPALASAQQQIADALLWKVSGNGLTEPSYLYGTLHAICMEDIRFTEGMLVALDNSKQLALEIDVTDPALNTKMQKAMLMKSNTRLSDLLPTADYELLAQYFQDSLSMNLAGFAQLKPVFLSSFIYNKLLGCFARSYETQLSQMALQQKMEVTGLETIEEQMKVFELISYQDQAEMLLQSIVEYDNLQEAYWNMVVSYKNQDLSSLYQIINEIRIGMMNYEKVMLTDRNQRWISRMEKMAKNKPTFFAVGAAHLPGNKGLINLLQNKGYLVEPVMY